MWNINKDLKEKGTRLRFEGWLESEKGREINKYNKDKLVIKQIKRENKEKRGRDV